MSPLVSIVIPLYNVERYVAECLESLKGQSFADFEAICIDDGSTDATPDLARRVVAGDSRFIFLSQRNAGQSAARNVGIERATGDCLMFLDSDDYLRPDALATMVETVDRDGLDYLDFSARVIYEEGRLKRVLHEDYESREDIDGIMPGVRLFAEYQQREQYHCMPCLHLFKRSLLLDSGLRFDEGHIHEDELFSPLLIAQAKRAEFLNEPLYIRRIRANSSITSKQGIHDVAGMFASYYKLREWVYGAASAMDGIVLDAYSQRVFELAELLARYINATPAEDVEAFADGLPADERAAFVECRFLARHLDRLLTSHSFRVGHALMKGPFLVKTRVGGLLGRVRGGR